MERKKLIIVIIATLIVGGFIGWLLKPSAVVEEAHEHLETSEDRIWTCSMHPQIRRNEPGDCPICGMDLIPAEDGQESGGNPNTYRMSSDAVKLANITTMVVGKGETATRELRLNGTVEVDERNVYAQSTHIPGRIEQLYINFTGESVRRGQALATVYSPELVTAQEELLQTARIRQSQPELFEAAKGKLRNWRIGENQINRIIESGSPIQRFPITADVSGIVTEKMVSLGDYVERGMPIYEIADLSKVWILFDLYESELAWVKEGSVVTYTVRSLPGEEFTGKISFIDPVLNSQTRVATARVEVNNSNGRLKPEMFVSGVVENPTAAASGNQITVPKSAVLWTGKRSIVYIKEDFGTQTGFTLREVTLGPSLGDAYVVEDGLNVGEEIVVNGTFTVDAAAQLAGKPSMMSPKVEGNLASVEISKNEKAALQPILNNYLELKNALVSDNFSEAKNKISEVENSIDNVEASQFSPEKGTIWSNIQQELQRELDILASAENIDEIRNNFDEFSATMIRMLKLFRPNEAEIYVQHCPMADNDKGAHWISASAEIKNPYFGSKMLKCGSVTEVVE